MKKITLLTVAMFAVFTMNAQVTIWEEGFETLDDFSIANFGDWTIIDVDGDATYGSNTYDWENSGYTGVSIVFNPSATEPSSAGTAYDARTGDKGMYFFAEAVQPWLNDDYLITPAFNLAGATGSNFSFWAKSNTGDFGLERFEVLLSTTGVAVGDFTVDLAGGEQQAPTTYTEYSYDLSDYDGQTVYVAIRYRGQDSFFLQTDDYLLTATSVLGVDEFNTGAFTYIYDKGSKTLNLESSNIGMTGVEIYSLLGQNVLSKSLSDTTESMDVSSLTDGVYIAKVNINGNFKTIKFVKN